MNEWVNVRLVVVLLLLLVAISSNSHSKFVPKTQNCGSGKSPLIHMFWKIYSMFTQYFVAGRTHTIHLHATLATCSS